MPNTSDSRTFDIQNNHSQIERLYKSRTDLISTPDGENLQTKLDEDNERHDEDLQKFKDEFTIQLTGEVTGKATGVGSKSQIEILTKPSSYNTHKIIIEGAVTGEAEANEDKVLTLNLEYDRDIPQKVKLTGDITGEGTVDPDGVITISVTNKKITFPVNSIQWSTYPLAEADLHNTLGGTWTCMGNIDSYIGGNYDSSKNAYTGGTPMTLYVYKKTSL